MTDVKVEEVAPIVSENEVNKTMQEKPENETVVAVEAEKVAKEEPKAETEKVEAEPEPEPEPELEPVAAVEEKAAPVADFPTEEKAVEEKTE